MASIEDKLDSVAETVVAIAYEGSDSEVEHDHDHIDHNIAGPSGTPLTLSHLDCAMFTPPTLASTHGDISGGPRFRMRAYMEVVGRVERRVQESLKSIYAPTTARVVGAVHSAYSTFDGDGGDDGSHLLPYTELPVIAVSGVDRGATASVLEDVRAALLSDSVSDSSGGKGGAVRVSEVTPADCGTISAAMKALVGGFNGAAPVDMDESDKEEGPSLRPLAPYDINLLRRSYDRLRQTQGESDLPKLVVLVNEFEKIEPAVMQDVFYICSLHVPQLPLIFVLGLSTPPAPSYLHAAYPRKTLALLRLARVEVGGGMEVLEKVLLDLFFDPTFDPTVSLSPSALSFVIDQFQTAAQSVDYVLALIQLILLRHYMDPLAIFANDELLGSHDSETASVTLDAPEARTFLLALLARLHHPGKSDALNALVDSLPIRARPNGKGKGRAKVSTASSESEMPWRARNATEALHLIQRARETHKSKARAANVAFGIMLEVRRHLLDADVLKSGGAEGRSGRVATVSELMIATLRGTIAGREGGAFKAGLKKLPLDRLSALTSALYAYVHALPSLSRSVESDAMMRFVDWGARLDRPEADTEARGVAAEMGEWLIDYMSERMQDYTYDALWDLWYTGNPHGIKELLNPAPRASIINALLHPDRYLGNGTENEEESSTTTTIPTTPRKKRRPNKEPGADEDRHPVPDSSMPDTCVAFQRYLESGRMLNVYDWYTAVTETLQARESAQRKAARARAHVHEKRSADPKSARANARSGGKGSGRERGLIRGKGRVVNGTHLPNTSPSPSPPPSPTKNRGRGRGRPRGRARGRPNGVDRNARGAQLGNDEEGDRTESDGGSDADTDENPEARAHRESQMHARFIRAVQELDYLGFVKHTGRRAEHVQRTVFDPPEM